MRFMDVAEGEWALRDDFNTTMQPPNRETYRNALFVDGHAGRLDLNDQPQ